jgi:multidrug resistance efflux pump
VSEIFDTLVVVQDRGVNKLKTLPSTQVEPTDGFHDVWQRPVVPADVDRFRRLKNHISQLPGYVTLSHKKLRKHLIFTFVVVALVLGGTNYALHPRGKAFATTQPIYGVAFEGTVHPANEIRITAELPGTVSNILVKLGDNVQKGQELLRMDDREAELGAKQAAVELEMAKAKLDKSRLELAEANARVAISQRQEQLVPSRQWRDSPERAAAAYDLALTNYNRAKKLYDAGVVAQQELDARSTELRVARDDLGNAKKLARVSTTLAHDQTDQVNLQAKVRRAELQEQLHEAESGYERAIHQLDATVVRATGAGVVSEIPVHLGDRVPGGTVLVRLAELHRMIAEVPVAAQMISMLKAGQQARVRLSSSPTREVDGQIRDINPLPSANMTHLVEVEFDNPTLLLLAGQPAEVRFLTP